MTQLSDAVRALLLGTPAGTAVTTSLLWIAAIIAVFTPLATAAYRRRA